MAQSRREEIQDIHTQYKAFYEIFGGGTGLLMLLVAGSFLFASLPVGNGFWMNSFTEAVGVIGTVVIVDRLNRRRALRERKEELIFQMGGNSNEFALQAVRMLRHKGWLRDGSLAGADLRGANLAGADLWDANLAGAELTVANLAGADLGAAKLAEAKLWAANLAGADLGAANLAGAKLRNANLAGAELVWANLGGANLFRANLERAILKEANLERAKLRFANLERANLTVANLGGAVL